MMILKKSLLYLLLIVGIGIVIVPFLYMFLTSLTADNYTLPAPDVLLRQSKSFNNYVNIWNNNHFSRFFLNSLLISTVTMVLTVSVASLTAYAFARFQFPGKELIFKVFLFTMFVPTMMSIIPQFTIIKGLGLVDNYGGLFLIYVGTGVIGSTFLLRGFFERIPTDMDESIIMDGGSKFTVFRAIYIPLSLPALGTLGIFSFSGTWDEFVVALTLIKTEIHRTLPIGLQLFRGQYATQYGKFFAGSVIALIPIIVIFILFQKQFVQQNISEGSIKT